MLEQGIEVWRFMV